MSTDEGGKFILWCYRELRNIITYSCNDICLAERRINICHINIIILIQIIPQTVVSH